MTDEVYIVVAIGEWREEGFEIVGAYADRDAAEEVAEEHPKRGDNIWGRAYVEAMEVTRTDD